MEGEWEGLVGEAEAEEYKELRITHYRMVLKTKEERLAEGITLLKKLRGVGIPSVNFGLTTIQRKISEWVSSGLEIKEVIPIPNYDRDAHLTLPSAAGAVAELVLRQIPK